MSRWSRFLIVIALGIVFGLLYGWVIAPVEYVDTTPDTLRADYQTDYVLMVAEIYQMERDLGLAHARLKILGDEISPAESAEAALIFAVDAKDYDPEDLRLLRDLSEALGRFDADSGDVSP